MPTVAVIPDEAVEAAAREIPAPSEPAAQEIARAALEAAAPLLMAQAWDEGEAAGQDNADSNRGYNIEHKTNPYRSQA